MEIKFEQYGDIEWRGLSEFSRGQRDRILEGLQNVEQLYDEAVRVLDHHPNIASEVMPHYFGSEWRSVGAGVRDAYGAGVSQAQAYRSPWGQEKFLGLFVDDEMFEAMVNVTDYHGRVAMSVDDPDIYSSSEAMAVTLGHELSHLKRASRLQAVGPATEDFFYIHRDPNGALPVVPYPDSNPRSGTSSAIVNGFLTNAYMDVSGVKSGFSRTVEFLSRDASASDSETAVRIFNQRPDISANMAARNADSIIFSAKHLSERYRSRL